MTGLLLATALFIGGMSPSADAVDYRCEAFQMWARYPLATATGAYWSGTPLRCDRIYPDGPSTSIVPRYYFMIDDDGGPESIVAFCIRSVSPTGTLSTDCQDEVE